MEFPLDQISTLAAIKKVLIISQDPTEIWQAFDTIKPLFFEEVFIEKYELGSSFKRSLKSHLNDQIKSIRDQVEKKLDNIDLQNTKDKKWFHSRIEAVLEDLRVVKAKAELDVSNFKETIYKEWQTKVKELLDQTTKKSETHLNHLVDELNQTKALLMTKSQRNLLEQEGMHLKTDIK